mmetsp:Transcript_23653/g.27775  ORF Transcript_23653/g.27775 Transcript_23653/m.27775 type:complete len:159 (-) Transcript_23653:236-712(-)|eukprot:CAMPEP_0114348430 /NCGR_PEP_ID=MMETSP0101-20121206/14693_1 /TAXON_ID=38822 ORGANISM="Pteridomonas danica, Strain PT" /NCGR_SAMPLE_ID=MMETSP0101 /ASSEMBLY_ACC=CAM_ASM_000211 /LENGTH=158 /DNA_ID=CAMNT_0001486333 /DNA_START=51 /DNA_END=527 /DNA_ORIENTATION=+
MERRASNPEHVTWDEEVIAEHDKLRGTRMKIDEPDTPFAYDDPEVVDDDEKGDACVLKEKPEIKKEEDLIEHKIEAENVPKASGLASLSTQWGDLESKLEKAAEEAESGKLVVGLENVENIKKKSFKDKRQKHYNEFEKVKEMREKMKNGELDDEDDE